MSDVPDLVPVAKCQSLLGRFPITVVSRSDPRKAYVVWTSPWNDVSEFICECEGYFFRGHCSHQEEAYARICRWSSDSGEEQQDATQRRARTCPRCGGPTQWVMEEET